MIEQFGQIDLFVSNAGITASGGIEVPDSEWQRLWDVNVLSHVYSAAVLPGMLERGQGYLLQTSSAAGLLTEIGSAPYSVTKHAAVSFAEWLVFVKYQRRGIRVSCLCPAGVSTDFLDWMTPFISSCISVRSLLKLWPSA